MANAKSMGPLHQFWYKEKTHQGRIPHSTWGRSLRAEQPGELARGGLTFNIQIYIQIEPWEWQTSVMNGGSFLTYSVIQVVNAKSMGSTTKGGIKTLIPPHTVLFLIEVIHRTVDKCYTSDRGFIEYTVQPS